MTKTVIKEALEEGLIDIKDLVEIAMEYNDLSKKDLVENIMGVDPTHMIQEMFMGYKQRKQRKQLYSNDNTIPTTLIKLYYEFADRVPFDTLKNSFVSKYIKAESKLEGIHSPEEIEGLGVMYEYIHSDDIDYRFDAFTLKDLHEKLYSKTEYPAFGGFFRNSDAHIKNFPSDLVPYQYIFYELKDLCPEAETLKAMAPFVREANDSELLLNYLDRCVVLGCKLIKIHPFIDGNGRSVRGFTNKLLEDAGLPPVYITLPEKDEYCMAMGKAIGDEDYDDIKNFYRYKICDSIVELDINRRIRGLLPSGEEEVVKIKK